MQLPKSQRTGCIQRRGQPQLQADKRSRKKISITIIQTNNTELSPQQRWHKQRWLQHCAVLGSDGISSVGCSIVQF
jgi:hypothetical protein